MSDSGFIDEGPGRERDRPAGTASRVPGEPAAPAHRRPPDARAVALVLVLTGLVAFAGWAWSGRLHARDADAYDALTEAVVEMDRTLTPLGHSESAPCRHVVDGVITRTYSPSTGPAAADVVTYLTRQGWDASTPTAPAVAHLSRVVDGRLLTVDVEAAGLDGRVIGLTARSAGSSFGCLLR